MTTDSYVTTQDGTQIYFKDWGPKTAQPIVFHHGWPLSSDDWDTQMMYFLAAIMHRVCPRRDLFRDFGTSG